MFYRQRTLDEKLERGFRIGEWRVLPQKGLVQKRGFRAKSIRVEPKPMQVLLALAMQPGKIISREALRRAVWDGRITSDHVITVAIRSLRKALADDVKTPKFIQTLPGRGYKLMTPPEFGPHLHQGKILASAIIAIGLTGLAAVWNPGSQTVAGIQAEAMAIAPELTREDRAAFFTARYIIYHGKDNGLRDALSSMEQLYPRYPDNPAIAITLAEAWFQMYQRGVYNRDLLTKSRALTRHALELDPVNSEIIGLSAALRYAMDWDAKIAEKNFKTAIRLAPAHWPSYSRYAQLLASQSRFDEAEQILATATVYDLNAVAKPDLAQLSYMRGDYNEAIERAEALLDIAPEDARIHYMLLSRSYEALGDHGQAIDYLQKAHTAARLPEIYRTIYSEVIRKGGLRGYYDYALKLAEWRKKEVIPQSPVVMAAYSLGAGKTQQAYDYLDEALSDDDPKLLTIAIDPNFHSLRTDAKFVSLVETIRHHKPS